MYSNATLKKKQKKVAVSAVFEINLNKKHPYFYWDFYKKTTAEQEALEEMGHLKESRFKLHLFK